MLRADVTAESPHRGQADRPPGRFRLLDAASVLLRAGTGCTQLVLR